MTWKSQQVLSELGSNCRYEAATEPGWCHGFWQSFPVRLMMETWRPTCFLDTHCRWLSHERLSETSKTWCLETVLKWLCLVIAYKEWIPCDPPVLSRLKVHFEKKVQLFSIMGRALLSMKTTRSFKQNSSKAVSTYHAPPSNGAMRKINEVRYPALSRSKSYIKTPGTL